MTKPEAAEQQFLSAVGPIRPRIHRYCARMSGSAFDGEDIVQETIAQAHERLSTLDDPARLEPWLFRIAHHKCIDLLRRDRRWREDVVSYDDQHDMAQVPDEPDTDDRRVSVALGAIVSHLPPKERAAVLLKDVLDYSLEDIATIIESTTGGVKTALHRGRIKLEAHRHAGPAASAPAERESLFQSYTGGRPAADGNR